MKKKKETAGEQLAPRHASAWQIFCRNKLAVVGLCFILFWVIMAVLAPVIAPFEPNALDYAVSQKPPGYEGQLLGTDQYGRDILTRVLYGARISMWCGVISVGISLVIGTVLGGIAGYYGGAVSIVIMRVMDAMCAFPSLVLAIVIAAAIGKGTVSAMLAVGIVSIPDYARLMFAETSSIRGRPYIEAGVAIGLKNSQLIFRHVLPNCMSQLLVKATLGLGFAILTVSSLSFLGMGVQPPTAEWGNMISEARSYIISGQWWMATFPGLAIMTSILGFNLVGDGVRDILDPRNRTGV
ncbi:Glutathione transport system permease protein gsiD [uncultured Flavonifractor sp.]|nr:Glutathione transport system permease protein gsiD [uncultured Flavonifractor sp.]